MKVKTRNEDKRNRMEDQKEASNYGKELENWNIRKAT